MDKKKKEIYSYNFSDFNRKFDLEYAHEILTYYYGIINFSFTEKESAIVPDNFEHSKLINGNNISDSVLYYYYLKTGKLINDEEFQKIVGVNYLGTKERAFIPFPYLFNGAFHNRIDLYHTVRTIIDYEIFKENKTIETILDLTDYFSEYAEGFKEGFNNYEKECLEPYYPMFADKQDYINGVYKFITNNNFPSVSWLSGSVGCSIKGVGQSNKYTLTNIFEQGKSNGQFYKAWSLILSNDNLFKDLFNNNESYLNKKSDLNKKKNNHQLDNLNKESLGYENSKLKLYHLFKSQDQYQKIINLLGEKKLINPTNSIWIDFEKGSKSIATQTIKDIREKGYLKKGQTLTNKDIKKILKNTFDLEISIETVKKAKIDKSFFSFIPENTSIT